AVRRGLGHVGHLPGPCHLADCLPTRRHLALPRRHLCRLISGEFRDEARPAPGGAGMSATRPQAVVVGGGLAGLAAAVAVARSGLETVHLAPKGPRDQRTSALMMPSVDYLRSAGLIDDPSSVGHPLTQIRIIDATKRLIRAPETLFDSAEAG